MDGYFAETTLRVDVDGHPGDWWEFVMRPLKVKELPLLLRHEGKGAGSDLSSFADFIDLVAGTVDGDIKSLSQEALAGIIQAFDELNFPEGAKKKGRQKPFEEREFARMIEFLISQGHSFSEIEEYTLPRFRLFVELAAERLSGKIKKKVDPMEALAGLGIPVRQ